MLPGSLRLKELAAAIGFSWRDPEPGGENSMAWYRAAIGTDAGKPSEQRPAPDNPMAQRCCATTRTTCWPPSPCAGGSRAHLTELPTVADLERRRSAGRHPQRPVQPDDLAVEVVLGGDRQHQRGVLVRPAESLRERHARGQRDPGSPRRPRPSSGCPGCPARSSSPGSRTGPGRGRRAASSRRPRPWTPSRRSARSARRTRRSTRCSRSARAGPGRRPGRWRRSPRPRVAAR